MKHAIHTFFGCVLLSWMTTAQTNQSIAHSSPSTWYQSQKVDSWQGFLSEHISELGLNRNVSFEIADQWEDEIGMSHIRSQQHVQNIPVEGAIYLLHGDESGFNRANGLVVKGEFENADYTISEAEAFLRMKRHYAPHTLYFQNESKEKWLKSFRQDDQATFKPKGELMYVNERFGNRAEDYALAWKFDVYVEKEIDREFIYIDAHSGEVLFTRQGCSHGCASHTVPHDINVPRRGMATTVIPSEGRGITRYIGEVDIIADSIADSTFILYDLTRGGGIRTYNAQQNTEPNLAVDFEDDDNYWDMVNPQKDEAAIDAHHGAEMTYDFWFENYNWSSFDGNGTPMLSYIHWDVGWFNASWNGMFSRYGDGRGDPLTYIDVVAHEFTHGLTGNTAGLVYAYESGAINESFSDIFGTAVEHYALGDEFEWFIGIPHDPFRNMSNPNQFGHPDTYKGDNWHTAASDNGGVHINSGVQNYWYYLLVNGGEGINDNGDDFKVDSIGWDKASAIAFRNLTVYLTPSSQYYDARLGSLQAAADLYGSCSPEVEAVAQAWAAVGLGSSSPTKDLQVLSVNAIESSCGLGAGEEVGISFRYNPSGCDFVLDSGTVIELGYKINDNTIISESFTLDSEIQEGEIFNYTFDETVDLTASGNYVFDYWVHIDGDDFAGNDTIFQESVSKPVQFDNNGQVIFRNFSSTLDSFLIRQGDNAEAEIYISTGNPGPGLLAMSITGLNASPGDIDFPSTEEENYILNPEYGASICFCVDLREWDNFYVNFDLRQTYSDLYRQFVGFDVPQFVSSMRLTVDGEQIGDQFHPETYTEDPWVNHRMDLSEFIGSQIELCFEGKHFLDRATDRAAGGSTQGDYTYLDNITFSGKTNVSTRDLPTIPVSLIPNPADERVRIQANFSTVDQVQLMIMDVSGRLVMDETFHQTDLLDRQIDVSQWQSGVYSVQLKSEHFRTIKKLVVD